MQRFPQDFAGFVHFNVLLQLLAFSLCSLRHLVSLQGLGKRKIAVCIFKQTIKIKSTMYWHTRIPGVIHMFLGSVRLLLCTANSTSPAFSSQPFSSVLHFSFSKKHQLWVRTCKTQLSSLGGRILRKLVPGNYFWLSSLLNISR